VLISCNACPYPNFNSPKVRWLADGSMSCETCAANALAQAFPSGVNFHQKPQKDLSYTPPAIKELRENFRRQSEWTLAGGSEAHSLGGTYAGAWNVPRGMKGGINSLTPSSENQPWMARRSMSVDLKKEGPPRQVDLMKDSKTWKLPPQQDKINPRATNEFGGTTRSVRFLAPPSARSQSTGPAFTSPGAVSQVSSALDNRPGINTPGAQARHLNQPEFGRRSTKTSLRSSGLLQSTQQSEESNEMDRMGVQTRGATGSYVKQPKGVIRRNRMSLEDICPKALLF